MWVVQPFAPSPLAAEKLLMRENLYDVHAAVRGDSDLFIGLFFSDAVAAVLCSNAELLPLVTAYVRVILLSAAAYLFLPGLAIFIRTDSYPKHATAALLSALGVLVVLDFVFIRVQELEIAGSAVATAAGYTVDICVLLMHFRKKSKILVLRRGGVMMIRLFGMNTLVLAALGTVGISIMAVCLNMVTLALMFIGGLAQTIQSIGGALCGFEKHRGVELIIRIATKFLLAALAVMVVVMFFFPQLFTTLFGLTDPAQVAATVPALRIFSFSLSLYSINYLLRSIYQVFGHRQLSTAISVTQSLMVVAAAAVLISVDPNLI